MESEGCRTLMKELMRLKIMAVQTDLAVSTRQPAMQIAPFACRDDELLVRQDFVLSSWAMAETLQKPDDG
jgi:hypothetical protein